MALTLANKITITRILAVPFFIGTILYYSPQRDYLRFVGAGIFLFAVISDAVDGFVARHWHQKTKAGAILDPLADKILLISAFICIYKVGVLFDVVRFPIWLVVAAISRDVMLLLGAMVIHLVNGHLEIEPTMWGKWTTFFQAVVIVGVLFQILHVIFLWYVALALILISGVDYLRIGMKALNSGVNT